MRGAIPPLPDTPSWRGAQVKHRETLPLPLLLPHLLNLRYMRIFSLTVVFLEYSQSPFLHWSDKPQHVCLHVVKCRHTFCCLRWRDTITANFPRAGRLAGNGFISATLTSAWCWTHRIVNISFGNSVMPSFQRQKRTAGSEPLCYAQ